jgi:glycosyltransferase involved in cell wall biosynthesis
VDRRPGVPGPAIYAAFDRFPAPKGAATHIGRFSSALFEAAGGGTLHCLGGRGLPGFQREGDVEIVRYGGTDDHPLDRAVRYGGQLAALVATRPWGTAQGRDPWSVIALLDEGRTWPVVYEVNGLPSIELAETHPQAAPAALARIAELERRCLAGADWVVTPSSVTAACAAARGAAEDGITVIPNGADVPAEAPPRPEGAPAGRYLVYAGALQRWQGVDVAVRALARLVDLDIPLVLVTGAPRAAIRPLCRLAANLGVAHLVRVEHASGPAEVAGWLAHATTSLAPLRDTARNTEQGCCPLKLLESLAVGTPVIASDLPVVRAEMTDGVHGRLVPPDRPADLARAIRVLLDHPDVAARWGRAGRAYVAASRSWEQAQQALVHVHEHVATLPRRG